MLLLVVIGGSNIGGDLPGRHVTLDVNDCETFWGSIIALEAVTGAGTYFKWKLWHGCEIF